MNDDDDPADEDDLKVLRESVLELRAELLNPEAIFEELGIEAGAFLQESAAFLAAMERDELESFDLAGFVARLTEFAREADAIMDIQLAAEDLAAQAAQEEFRARVALFAEKLEELSGTELRLATAVLRKQCEREMPEPQEEENWSDDALHRAAGIAETRRRRHLHSALVCQWWESRPPEWQEEHGAGQLLAQWDEEREQVLGELPLEDVGMLESLTAADLDRPEIWRRVAAEGG